jgi:uncharacterized damage-inducible protein DinB
MHIRTLVVSMALLALTAVSAAAQNPVSDAMRSSWNGVKRNIKESAELMPAENYDFKPTPEVRSFGAILAHVAGASYMFCASAKNEKAPFEEDSFEGKLTTKAQLVKVTNDAIAYCDGAFAALTDAAPDGKHVDSLLRQIGHDNEHYGNLVTYFRLKGLVPPSSRR